MACRLSRNQDEAAWWKAFHLEVAVVKRLIQDNDERRAKNNPHGGPLMELAGLDSNDLHHGRPDGRRGLGNIEIFMRHCEAWRLHCRADATYVLGLNPPSRPTADCL